MLTLLDIQTSSLKNVSGFCSTSPQFTQAVNEVIERLMPRGDWKGTVLPVRVGLNRGCVTWPRHVGKVRRINGCRHQTKMRSLWYEFLAYQGERHLHEWQGWLGRERNMTMQYYAPTYNDVPNTACSIRVYPSKREDVGAVVTIFGMDNNNQPLQTQNTDGTWSMGIPITVALPFGTTTNQYFVSKIDRVVKTVTQGNLMVYSYDNVAQGLFDLAVYEPSETSPSYLRYELDGGYNQGSCSTSCTETVIALVKLKYIPASVPSDLIIIDSIGALKFGLMAWKREEANDFGGAAALWQESINELNRQLEDETPDAQLPVSNAILGNRTWTNRAF